MAAKKLIRKRKVQVHDVETRSPTGGVLEYQARTDEHGRMIYDEGIMCYEAMKDGSLVLYADRGDGESVEVTVKPHDVDRLMYAAIDAMKKHASRR